MIDGANKQKIFTYDKLQQLKTVTEANNALTTYYYDLSGNLRATVMADGYTKTHKYNEYGQVIEEKRGIDPVITYRYDTAGNLISLRDRKGQEIRIFYDRIGNPVRQEFYDVNGLLEDEHHFEYDRGGNLTTANNNISTIDLKTNALGQVESETQSIKGKNYSLSYAYDKIGKVSFQQTNYYSTLIVQIY